MFFLIDSLRNGVFHNGLGYIAECAAGQEECLAAKGDVAFGALHFADAGTLIPLTIDVENGEVTWFDKGLELSLQVNSAIPSFWSSGVGIGKVKGSQINAYFDFASVPNEDGRADLSPVMPQDKNYLALAGQYNLYALGTASSSDFSGNLQYLPSTTCGDFAFSSLRWFSEVQGVTLVAQANQKGCFGGGCSQSSIEHQQVSFVSSDGALPTVLGSAAGKDCAEFWDYLTKNVYPLNSSFTASDEDYSKALEAVKASATFQKGCVYKNKVWYQAAISLFGKVPFDLTSTNFYTCEHSPEQDCTGVQECYIGGACLKGDAFWTPAPYAGVAEEVSASFESGSPEALAKEIVDTASRAAKQGVRGQWFFALGVVVPDSLPLADRRGNRAGLPLILRPGQKSSDSV